MNTYGRSVKTHRWRERRTNVFIFFKGGPTTDRMINGRRLYAPRTNDARRVTRANGKNLRAVRVGKKTGAKKKNDTAIDCAEASYSPVHTRGVRTHTT